MVGQGEQFANNLGLAWHDARCDEGGDGAPVIANPNLSDYRIPTALDVPDIDAIVIESDEPNGPFGAKEVGEGGIRPVIPAILNAIYDATGVVIDELPASPERILRGLRKGE